MSVARAPKRMSVNHALPRSELNAILHDGFDSSKVLRSALPLFVVIAWQNLCPMNPLSLCCRTVWAWGVERCQHALVPNSVTQKKKPDEKRKRKEKSKEGIFREVNKKRHHRNLRQETDTLLDHIIFDTKTKCSMNKALIKTTFSHTK